MKENILSFSGSVNRKIISHHIGLALQNVECLPTYFQVLLFRGENAPHRTVSAQHCKTTGLYNHIVVITIVF